MQSILAISLLLLSSSVFAACDIIEDPPVSEVNCTEQRFQMPTGSEWTRVAHNPNTSGLKVNGGISAAATVEMSAADALVGKIQATTPMLDKTSVSAGTDESVWVDLIIHRNATGNSFLELVAYRYVAGSLLIENSVTSSSTLSSVALSSFGVSYSYASGSLAVNVTSASSGLSLASMTVANFGQTLPVLKLRRGTQPSNSGVNTASFVQNGFWSN